MTTPETLVRPATPVRPAASRRPEPPRPRRRPLVTLVAVAALVACGIAAVDAGRRPVPRRPDAAADAGRYDRIRISVDRAAVRNAAAVEACESQVGSILARSFAEIREAGHAAAADLAGFGACCGIIGRLARDRLEGTSRAETYVDERMQARLEPALRACSAELDAALTRFDLAMRTSTTGLATDLSPAPVAGAGRDAAITVELDTAGDLPTALGGLARQGISLTLSTAFDAWAIVHTSVAKGLLQKTVALAARMFARPAATAAASATAAVVDGPLPLGDVITVVGTAWTAYDVHRTRRTFRADLQTAVDNALPEMKRNVHAQVMERVQAVLEGHQRTQDAIRHRSLSRIGR